MSNSDYNKIISTINSVSRDYTYSPDPNNLICSIHLYLLGNIRLIFVSSDQGPAGRF